MIEVLTSLSIIVLCKVTSKSGSEGREGFLLRMALPQEMFEKECQMALQDRVQEETNERKNALEAYIYSLRNKLADSLADYVTDAERADLSGRLEKAEVRFWLQHRTTL